MANARKLQVQLQLNTDAAKKSLTDLTNATRTALNPSGSTSAFIKENTALDQMNAKLKLLATTQQRLAQEAPLSKEYAKVTNEIANIIKRQQGMVTTEGQYLALLKAETAEREKAAKIQQSGGGFAKAQGAASQVFGATGLPGGGLLGASGPAGALIASASALAKVFDEMGEKAKNTASIISDSGGKYDQLTQSVIKNKQAQDRLASDPVFAAFAKFKTDLETSGLDVLKGAIDKFSQVINSLPVIGGGNNPGPKPTGNATKLKGDALVEYENLKHERISMEKEIAMSEQQFKIETARKARDLAIENQKFDIEQSRKKYDLEKQYSRENQDYALSKQKLTEDQAFKTSQKKFQIDQQFEQRAFQQKQQDEQQDFVRQQQYKKQDLAKDLGREGRDFNNQLADMAIGGASGMDYLKAVRDQGNKVSDKVQDYKIEQGRAGTEFGIKQGREGRDFTQGREKTQKEHQLDVEQHYYDLRYQSIELEMKHSRAIQDVTTNLERLAQDTAMGKRDLANKASDLAQDTSMTRGKMDFDESEKRRNQTNSENAFGRGLGDKLPADALNQLMKSDPNLAAFVQGGYKQAGLATPTGGSSSINTSGSMGGDAVAAVKAYYAAHPELKAGASNLLKSMNLDAFADGGYVPRTGPALVHEGEVVLNQSQQISMFGRKLSGTDVLNMSPMGRNRNIGAGYGMGGGTGLVAMGNTPLSNATANGSPMPIQMAGNMPPTNNINVQMAGNSYSADMPSELKQILDGLAPSIQAQIKNAMSGYMAANLRSQYNTINQGWR